MSRQGKADFSLAAHADFTSNFTNWQVKKRIQKHSYA